MKFRFRLEKVLEHRRRLEEEARRNLLAVRGRIQEVRDRISDCAQSIVETRRRRYVDEVRGESSKVLVGFEQYIYGQKERIAQYRLDLRQLMIEEEDLFAMLAQAATDRRAIERLREKKLAEYQHEVARRERAEIDELVVMRHNKASIN